MKLAKSALFAGLVTLLMACGSESQLGTAELDVDIVGLAFSGSSGTVEAQVDPLSDNAAADFVAAIGQIACGAVDLNQSFLTLSGFSPADAEDEGFKLTVSLVDGAQEAVLLEWSSTLRKSSKAVPFTSDEIVVSSEGTGQLIEVLKRQDPRHALRFDFAGGPAAQSANFRAFLKYRVATDSGSCPATPR